MIRSWIVQTHRMQRLWFPAGWAKCNCGWVPDAASLGARREFCPIWRIKLSLAWLRVAQSPKPMVFTGSSCYTMQPKHRAAREMPLKHLLQPVATQCVSTRNWHPVLWLVHHAMLRLRIKLWASLVQPSLPVHRFIMVCICLYLIYFYTLVSYSFALLFLCWFGEGSPRNDHYCRSTLLNIGPSAIHQRPNVGLVDDSFLSTASWTCEPMRWDHIKTGNPGTPLYNWNSTIATWTKGQGSNEWSTLISWRICVQVLKGCGHVYLTMKSLQCKRQLRALLRDRLLMAFFTMFWCNSTGGKESQNFAEQLSHAIQPFAMPKNLMPGNLNDFAVLSVCS